jgi:FkbM family methyltransferase
MDQQSSLDAMTVLNNKIDHVFELVNALATHHIKLHEDKWIYKRHGEKHRFKKVWNDFDPHDARIYDLLHGLDSKSAETVIRVIKRLHTLIENNFADTDLFTKKEKKQLAKLAEDIEHGVIKIKDDLYAYRHYFLPIERFEASVFYNNHCLEHIDHLDRIKDRQIIDVGAFIGDSALVFQSLQAKNIYSFEAVSTNFDLLNKTIALNHLTNVTPVLLALGAQKEELEITLDGICSAFDHIYSKDAKKETIQVDTLDHYVAAHNITDIALIKVDIEGHEQQFLKGAIETIKTHKPTLMISIYHTWDDFISIKPWIEALDLGYRFRIVKPIDDGIVTETLLFAEIP